jgi:hypothetical protein
VYQKSDKHLGDLSDVLTKLLDANTLHTDNELGTSEAIVSSDEEKSMRRVKELQQALYFTEQSVLINTTVTPP